MSVRINPCHGCPIGKGCELRKEFKARVAGLELRSATFNCAIIESQIGPGTRVYITHPFVDVDEGDVSHVRVPATIISRNGTKFSCVIDPDDFVAAGGSPADADKYRFRKSMRHTRILGFVSEPRRQICEFGNQVLPNGKHDARYGECSCVECAKWKAKTEAAA